MSLIQSLEKNGRFLFKYRGQIPVLFFVLCLPLIYFGDYDFLFCCHKNCQSAFINITLVFSIAVSLLGFIVRAYTIGTTPRGTSGRNTKKQVAKQLNTTGIYSIVRHPLYLGNYLMWAGLLIFTMNIYIFIIVSLLYWIYYERIMFMEERFLEKQFGEQFTEWSQNVPTFFPAFSKFVKSDIPFSFKAVLRREYSGFFAMVFSYTITDYWLTFTFMQHHFLEEICWIRPSLYALCVAFVIMLVLRTLKHSTTLLNPDHTRD